MLVYKIDLIKIQLYGQIRIYHNALGHALVPRAVGLRKQHTNQKNWYSAIVQEDYLYIFRLDAASPIKNVHRTEQIKQISPSTHSM